MKILLGSQSYKQRSKAVTGQRLVNLYSEQNPEGSEYPFSLYGTAGLTEWADTSSSKGLQGVQKMGGDLYAVSGNTVYKITSAAVVSTVGTISGAEDRVDLSNNGTQMTLITSAGLGYSITSASVTLISDADFPTASSTTFLDQYTVVSKASSGQFFISALLDNTSWAALDFATAEEAPDNLVRVTSFNNALWLFGQTSYEVYYNSGNADFPFEQIPGSATTALGCIAKYSVAQDVDMLFWLGSDKNVYKNDGYKAKQISTFAVGETFRDYATVDDAIAFIYTEGKHKYYVLTFPTQDATWVYDISTNNWHERTTLTAGVSGIWRANSYESFADKNLVGDHVNGKIYELDLDVYTEDGGTIERIVEGSVQEIDDVRIVYDRVRLNMDAGVGLITGQGSDPQVMMSFTDDGGETYSSEKWRSFGKIGEFNTLVVWRRLGQARQRLFRWKVTDPVKVSIRAAYADGRLGKV